MVLTKRGEVTVGLRLLSAARNELRGAGVRERFHFVVGALAEGLADGGEPAEGLAVIEEAIERVERGEKRWCLAELLRLKGELLLRRRGLDAASDAESFFLDALDWARRQGALSWELRAATSLARLWGDQDRGNEANDLLAPLYARFTEGFETSDLEPPRRSLMG